LRREVQRSERLLNKIGKGTRWIPGGVARRQTCAIHAFIRGRLRRKFDPADPTSIIEISSAYSRADQ
jgi:hypothetical protein